MTMFFMPRMSLWFFFRFFFSKTTLVYLMVFIASNMLSAFILKSLADYSISASSWLSSSWDHSLLSWRGEDFLPTSVNSYQLGSPVSTQEKGGVCFLRETLKGWPCQTSRVNGHQEARTIPGSPSASPPGHMVSLNGHLVVN